MKSQGDFNKLFKGENDMNMSSRKLFRLARANGDIDIERDKAHDISKELKELYIFDPILYCSRDLNIVIDTRNMFHNPPYIRFYDNILPKNASYCARISLLGPEYIICNDSKVPSRPLTIEHKKILIDIINGNDSIFIYDNWDSFKHEICESLEYFDQHNTIDFIANLPKLDYTNLPTR